MQDKTYQFFSNYPEIKFGKNKTIISPEDSINHIYLIKTGRVRMYSISADGQEAILHIFQEGSYIPIMLVIAEETNRYFFVTEEEVFALKAPRQEVIDYLKSDPEVLYDLTQKLAKGINGFILRTESLTLFDAYEKVENLVKYLAEKFGKGIEDGNSVQIECSHEDIAAWLGIRRETVSRQLEKMQEEGKIEIKKKRILLKKP